MHALQLLRCVRGRTFCDMQAAANAHGGDVRIAVLHEQFAHVLVTDFPASLRYAKPGSPVFRARLGPDTTYERVDLILFPVHWPDHWVRSTL